MAEGRASAAVQGVIVDTDVLVWYLRGSEQALRFLTRIPHHRRGVSSLGVMELIQGCRTYDESTQVNAFITDGFARVVHPDESISRRAIDLLEEHARSHGLRVVDALIAATAIETRSSLATANVKHYRAISRLRVIPFKQ